MSDTAPRSGDAEAYGLLALGASCLALPLDALREVLPRPAAFSALPISGTALLGAVDLRGTAVPVLDLAEVLSCESSASPTQVVVIVASRGRLLGLLVDAVVGITSVRRDDLHLLARSGGADQADERLLLHGTFTPGPGSAAEGAVVAVLDVDAVAQLPRVLTVVEPATRTDDSGPAADRTVDRPLVLVRCGPVGLALDLAHVQTIQPSAVVRESCLQGGACVGVLDHGDLEIPVVDPLALLGLGALDLDLQGLGDGPLGTPLQALVLRLDRGFVALLLTDVDEVARPREDDVLPLPPVAVRRPELFAGLVRTAPSEKGDAVAHLLLDVAALLRDEDLQALSGLNTSLTVEVPQQGGPRRDAVDTAGTDTPAPSQTYLTYRSGIEMASPLDQVDEIVPLPDERSVVGDAHGVVLGAFLHRGALVPLVCLSQLLGRPPLSPDGPACVVLVQDGGSRLGLVVSELHDIEASTWEEGSGQGTGSGTDRLVQFGASGAERLLPAVDLRAVVRGVTQEHADATTLALSASG